MEEEKRICDHCGCVLSENEGTTVGDEVLCETCVEDYCITCDHCGEVIYTDDCITDDHTRLCQECYDDYYRRCESCDRIIHENDVNWHCDLPYCDSCYDDIESDEEIEEYSYKPCPIFYGKGEDTTVWNWK